MVLHRFHRCRLAMHPAIATWSEHPPRPHLSMAKNSWPESKWHFSAFLKVKVHNYIHSGNNARGEFVLKTPFSVFKLLRVKHFLLTYQHLKLKNRGTLWNRDSGAESPRPTESTPIQRLKGVFHTSLLSFVGLSVEWFVLRSFSVGWSDSGPESRYHKVYMRFSFRCLRHWAPTPVIQNLCILFSFLLIHGGHLSQT